MDNLSDVYVNRKPFGKEHDYTQGSTSVEQFESISTMPDEQASAKTREEYLSLVVSCGATQNGVVTAANNRDFFSLNQMLLPLVEGRSVEFLDSVCALHWCCYAGHVDLVNKMLDAGVDPFYPDPVNYESPVYYAIKASNAHVISILLKTFGPLVLCHENRKSKTPFMAAVSEFATDDILAVLHVLEFLYLSGVSLEEQDVNVGPPHSQGTTALMYACRRGKLYVVQWLLKKGADLSHRDHFGATVMHYAAMGASLDVVRFLAQSGAAHLAATRALCNCAPSQQPVEQTPLEVCRERGNHLQYLVMLLCFYNWRVFARVATVNTVYPVLYWVVSALNMLAFFRMWRALPYPEAGAGQLSVWLFTFVAVQALWFMSRWLQCAVRLGDPGVSPKTNPRLDSSPAK